jgi:hypothetical protein
MPFNPTSVWMYPIRLIQSITADWIGIPTGTEPTRNLSDLVLRVDTFLGVVATTAARDAIIALAGAAAHLYDGHWIAVRDQGNGLPAFYMFTYGPPSVWSPMGGGGTGGTAGTSASEVMGDIAPIGTYSSLATTPGKFYLPTTLGTVFLFKEELIQFLGADYTIGSDTGGRYVLFNPGATLTDGMGIWAAVSRVGLASSNATTLGGLSPDAANTPNTVVVRASDGTLANAISPNELLFYSLWR